MSKLIVNKPCSNCNSPLRSVTCIYYDYNAQISTSHKHNSYKLIGKAICIKGCETYTSVYEQCVCGWPNSDYARKSYNVLDSDDELYEVVDMTQAQSVPIVKKIFGQCLKCNSDITSYDMHGGKCANGHIEFYDTVTTGDTRIKRPYCLHSTKIVASPCGTCAEDIVAISYVYVDAGVKYNTCTNISTCKINPNALIAVCLCSNEHVTNTTVREVCMCKICSNDEKTNNCVLFKTLVNTVCSICKRTETQSISKVVQFDVNILVKSHMHIDRLVEAYATCVCGHESKRVLRQQCSCGFDSYKLDTTLELTSEPVSEPDLTPEITEHRTSFMTNLCMLCSRETKTADVICCGSHTEYTEVPVTCLKGHRTLQQLFSKCTCMFKSSGYVEPVLPVAAPLLTPIPRDPCIICDKPIVHINYKKPTNSVFINDQIHNHISDTYTSTAVCVNGHHTSTTVAYHCVCGWPNDARLKKWQRIQELVANHTDLKYIEDASLATNVMIDGFPDEHTSNDKPLDQFEKHPLVAETIYTPAYACSTCDANIRYISTITPVAIEPYISNKTIHLHDSTEYICIVTCKNYHVTSAKIIRHCSCGWPDKSLIDNYTDTLDKMDKAPVVHGHTGNCRCWKPKPKRLPANPLYNKQLQEDKLLISQLLLRDDSVKINTDAKYTLLKPAPLKPTPQTSPLKPAPQTRLQLTTMLMAKDPCSVCNGVVSTVTEGHRTEVYYMPFVEDGIEHNHDRNIITGDGVCENGHVLADITLYDVCECGWPINSKKVVELQNKLTAKYSCYVCNSLVSSVKETITTLAYYRPFVDSSNKRHTHNQNIVRGDGVCVNGHILDNIELCYKCECGWPGDTGMSPAKQLDAHTHTFNTEQCCICAASTTDVKGPRNTTNDTSDTIYVLVKCTNGHLTSQRCPYTCGPPCYVDKLRSAKTMAKKKQIASETMLQFRPVTVNNITSQLTHGDCPLCGHGIESCTSVEQTNTLYKQHVDANGIIHNHDCNTISGIFTCVNSHTCKQSLGAKCSCGWVRSVPFTTRVCQLIGKLTNKLPVRSTAKPLAPTAKPLAPTAKPLVNQTDKLTDAIDSGLKL